MILYLHGFASSPASNKARFFSERLAAAGYEVVVPDLAEGNFEGLTVSGQLAVIERAAAGRRVTVMGSSLGGYLAALHAARRAEVERVVLMAPAFGFARRWERTLGQAAMEEWERTGRRAFFHYGEGREAAVGWGLMEDGRRYEEFPDVRQPALVFHGRNDTVVPCELSRMFAEGRANVRLRELESDHELLDMRERMWTEVEAFLRQAGGGPAGR